MAYASRTRFAKDIVTEFFPPARKTKRQKVVIICGGMPGMPGSSYLLEFFSKKGFWVFNPRYRGTWESGGATDWEDGLAKAWSTFDPRPEPTHPNLVIFASDGNPNMYGQGQGTGYDFDPPALDAAIAKANIIKSFQR